MEKSPPSPAPLWERALERYRDELGGNEDYQAVNELHSLEDLLTHVNNLQNEPSRNRQSLASLNRLAPKFKFLDDFSAVIALTFGADPTLTAVVWGSVRLILTLASSAADTLQDVLDMLEELSLTLPRFRVYEDTLPMSRQLETALVDVYAEVICFYARTIHFFRDHPHVLLRRNSWEKFRTDFSRTNMRIKRISSVIESEADLARMRLNENKYKEVLELMDNLSTRRVTDNKRAKYQHIPLLQNNRFSGRSTYMNKIERALDPTENHAPSPRSMALFGMGGVGKTQLALEYAHRSAEKYDVVLWILADSSITIGQSFREVAQGLQLCQTQDEVQDSAAAIWKVKNWLNLTNSSWLVVFDNADDLQTLKVAWPRNPRGSILLTTRDFDVARNPAAECLQLEPFDDAEGCAMLLKQIGLDSTTTANQQHAMEITRALGGLPLALSQIGGFIAQRRLALKDLLPLYERNSVRIDASRTTKDDYEHTLSTVWNVSFERLPKHSTILLNMMIFLDPDSIDETIFLQGAQAGIRLEPEFEFLADEMDLGDAEEALLKVALINKTIDRPTISIHRLVQSAALHRLADSDRSRYFNAIVKLLSWGFPDTWSKDVGHQISAWEKCEKCLPHIDHLAKLAKRHSIRSSHGQRYAELLLRSSWYLYEREAYDTARGLVDAAVSTFEDKTTLAFASAIDLVGLIDLDLCQPERAVQSFKEALEIRKTRLGADDAFIASSLNNIALAYTEMGSLDEAYSIHQQAIDIRQRINSDRVGNSYSNMASLLLRMGNPDGAEDMLAQCPSLKDFTDETFLNTGNPRFSGDMVLLSRIRLKQGRTDDALRLASKALAFRQRLLGNRLKTCDSMYDVASILHRQQHVASAITLLEKLVDIAGALNEGEGQLARALYKLSVVYHEKGATSEAEDNKMKALEIRNRLRPHEQDAPFEEESFSKLTLWMLW
ncbi:putative NB-ARC and TPR domain protein [Rosellinia necatrix]|uniref:Putative NB-ARC and TPR domain protein n=1 Tax=Rosellinia necatrix TaxID=77044 RepID=A0A1S7ULH3_ROSNE|nr:putative NB-ARC and TPR domain protein [Rosellinia necatrix]